MVNMEPGNSIWNAYSQQGVCYALLEHVIPKAGDDNVVTWSQTNCYQQPTLTDDIYIRHVPVHNQHYFKGLKFKRCLNTIPVRNASCIELRCDTVCCNNFGIKLVIHLNWANYWHKLPTNVCIVCFATRNLYIHTYRNVVRRYSPYDTIRNPTSSKTQPGFSKYTVRNRDAGRYRHNGR